MSTFQVSGVRNRQRDFDCAAGATVTNLPGSATVYYRDELPIDEDTNDGMIVAGASVSLSGQQYFFVKPVQVNGKDDPLAVAPTANVLVVLVPVPAERTGPQGALTAYLATLASGAEYSWTLTNGQGVLLDIITGKKP